MTVEDRVVRETAAPAVPRQESRSDEVVIDLTEDRRRPTAGARVSWAQPRPWVTEAGPSAISRWNPLERSQRRQATWRRPYALRAVLGDSVIAGASVGMSVNTTGVDAGVVAFSAATGAVLWLVALLVNRGYDGRRLGTGPEEFQSVMRATWLMIAALAVGAYVADVDVPRRVVLIAVPAAGLLTALHRHLLRRDLHRRRNRGAAMLRTLVVGDVAAVTPVVADLSIESHHGYAVIGACLPVIDLDAVADGEQVAPVRLLGAVGDVPQVVVDHDVDVVIVAGSYLSGPSLRRLSWALDRVGADLVVSPGVVEVAGPHVSIRPAAGLSLLHLEQPSRHLGRELGKAVLDRVVGSGLLALATLPLLLMALAVGLTSRGPVFFRQVRAGVDGNPFTMWKLRTMVVDAEQRRAEILDDSDRDGLMFKMKVDPRITPVGRVLRRFSLDELPQLWNVVRGDMSLVGPRPPLMTEFEQYHDAVNRRLRVRPGLTGLWQVSGRADLDWEQSINLDLRYVDNWSLALDLQILWKTVRAVVGGSGAY